MRVSISYLSHLLLLLVLSLLDHAYAQIATVGSPCTLIGGKGKCGLIEECQPVFNSMMAGIPPQKFCGHIGSTPIVCCPNYKAAPRTTTSLPVLPTTVVNRPSTRMCAHYAKLAFTLVRPPVLLGGDEPLVNVSLATNIDQPLIIGGSKAAPKEFPHMAAIGYNNGSIICWDCGGTLISELFVLTAAHCTVSPRWGDAHWVRVGDLNLRQTTENAKPQDRRIVEIIRHPKYKVPAQYNDIALLRLQMSVTFTPYVRPACLDIIKKHPAGEKSVATGWGIVDWTDDTGSEDLLKVTLPIVAHSKCASFYTNDTTRLPHGINRQTQICAGVNSKDTCQGDSGGPLAIFSTIQPNMFDIIGVTSFGQLCGSVSPGVYSRVYFYLSWIEKIVWPLVT